MTNSQPMHILYVSQYFPPEVGAGSARAFELAKHWVRAGHRVTALTGFPSYPTGWNGNGNGAHPIPELTALSEYGDRLRVVRSWAMGVGSRTPRERLMAWSSFSLSSSLRGIAIPKPDVVLASSPPLTVGMTGWWLSRLKRKPFVFDVRDLWPESVRDLAGAKPGAVADRTLDAMAGFLYRSADRVVVTSEATRQALLERGKTGPAITFTIPNGVETDMFAPQPLTSPNREKFKQSLGLGGKFIVSFIGTIGLAQDLDLIIRAAEHLSAAAHNSRPPRIAEHAHPYDPPAQPPTAEPAPNLPYRDSPPPPTAEHVPLDLPFRDTVSPPTAESAPPIPFSDPSLPPTGKYAPDIPFSDPFPPTTAEYAPNLPAGDPFLPTMAEYAPDIPFSDSPPPPTAECAAPGDIHFLFVGEGPTRQRVIDAVRARGLQNFTFMPAQPRERIPAFIQASDICLVTLRQAPVNDVIIPFRMLEFMACARPVLLSAAGESARILKDANAGLIIPQGNPEALAQAILHLRQNPALRHQAGQNGSRYITQNFSRQQMAQTYLEVLKEAIRTPTPTP